MTNPFVDIHCHVLPGLDDGPADWNESLAMARLAAEDGVGTVVATPHQLGSFSDVRGEAIKQLTAELERRLAAAGVPLRVLPGGELRIDPEMLAAIRRGEALTLGDHGQHVLLELPHDLYLPLDTLLSEFARRKMVAILAHPERNRGILRQPEVVRQLVDAGCLMQVTASSFCSSFGSRSQQLAEWMLGAGLVHVVASDGHGSRLRQPLFRRPFERIAELVGEGVAVELCCHNPARIAAGEPVPHAGRQAVRRPVKRRWFAGRGAG